MKSIIAKLKLWLVVAVVATLQNAHAKPVEPSPVMLKGEIQLKSLTSIAFSKEGVLFLADPLGMKIYALDEKRTTAGPVEQLEVTNIDEKIAALLGVSTKDIKIEDMAVNPTSHDVYLAVTRRGASLQPAIARVDSKGNISAFNLNNVSYYETSLADIPAKSPHQYFPLSSAITDMAFIDGELYVAGLSGDEFNSKLRRFQYPFTNKTQAIQLEIFHPSHDRFETNAPIETFLPFPVNGKMHILAGYGCAPLAKFQLSDVQSKDQLRGVTVAELGGGNRPLDMISFKDGNVDYMLIANSDRTLMQISSEDLDKQTGVVKGDTRVPPYASVGVKYLSIAEVGILQLDDFNDQSYLVVQRNVDDGTLNLRSKGKLKPSTFRVRGLVEELRLAGKLKQAEDEIVKYEPTGDRRSTSVMWYNLACSYALGNDTNNAFKYLDKALVLGYNERGQYENDPDLVSLKGDKRWKELSTRLK
ncbi:hypothetical protein WBG78_04645 [Chryseolinea sp. T2]|uniref:TPR end-of-group domain-containing protein n=1 Tax=Chryseolinea sp. T2 TaxID=3129255 RepID=UPI003076C756